MADQLLTNVLGGDICVDDILKWLRNAQFQVKWFGDIFVIHNLTFLSPIVTGRPAV